MFFTMFSLLFSDSIMVKVIEIRRSRDSKILHYCTNCNCNASRNLLEFLCEKFAIHQLFLGGNGKKRLFSRGRMEYDPNNFSRTWLNSKEVVAHPKIDKASSWLDSRKIWTSLPVAWRREANNIIDIKSLRMKAVHLSFSAKMLPTLPALMTLSARECCQKEHAIFITWKFEKNDLQKHFIISRPPNDKIPIPSWEWQYDDESGEEYLSGDNEREFNTFDYDQYDLYDEQISEFYLTTKLTFKRTCA